MRLLLISFVFISTLSTCAVDEGNGNNFKSTGLITGYDMRMCACCGGWIIKIDSSKYRFFNLPDGSNLDLEHSQYPVEVVLDWKKADKPCLGDEILVTRIKMSN